MNNLNKHSPISRKQLKYGSIATALTVLFIVGIVVANVIFGILADRFPSLTLDMTAEKSFSLKKESVRVCNGISLDTEILLIGTEDTFFDKGLSQIPQLAARYAAMTDKITYRYVDIQKNPTFATGYPNEELLDSDVIIRSEKRYRVLTIEDMFIQDEETGALSSEAEVLMTTAIMAVNSDKLPVVGFVTGHEELADTAGLQRALNMNNFECREINLITDDVMRLTDVLVIASPVRDLTEMETQKLDQYLENGQALGKHLLVTFDADQPDTPNLNLFLKDWGIEVGKEILVETDAEKTQGNSRITVFGAPNAAYEPFGGIDLVCLTKGSRKLTLLQNTPGLTGTTLVTSFETAVTVTAPPDGEDFDVGDAPKGLQNMLVLSETEKSAAGDRKFSSVAVSGSSFFFSPSLLGVTSVANLDITLALFREVTGSESLEDTVNILPTALVQYDLSAVSSATATLIGLTIFSIFVPLLILGAGLFMYFRRRHL